MKYEKIIAIAMFLVSSQALCMRETCSIPKTCKSVSTVQTNLVERKQATDFDHKVLALTQIHSDAKSLTKLSERLPVALVDRIQQAKQIMPLLETRKKEMSGAELQRAKTVLSECHQAISHYLAQVPTAKNSLPSSASYAQTCTDLTPLKRFAEVVATMIMVVDSGLSVELLLQQAAKSYFLKDIQDKSVNEIGAVIGKLFELQAGNKEQRDTLEAKIEIIKKGFKIAVRIAAIYNGQATPDNVMGLAYDTVELVKTLTNSDDSQKLNNNSAAGSYIQNAIAKAGEIRQNESAVSQLSKAIELADLKIAAGIDLFVQRLKETAEHLPEKGPRQLQALRDEIYGVLNAVPQLFDASKEVFNRIEQACKMSAPEAPLQGVSVVQHSLQGETASISIFDAALQCLNSQNLLTDAVPLVHMPMTAPAAAQIVGAAMPEFACMPMASVAAAAAAPERASLVDLKDRAGAGSFVQHLVETAEHLTEKDHLELCALKKICQEMDAVPKHFETSKEAFDRITQEREKSKSAIPKLKVESIRANLVGAITKDSPAWIGSRWCISAYSSGARCLNVLWSELNRIKSLVDDQAAHNQLSPLLKDSLKRDFKGTYDALKRDQVTLDRCHAALGRFGVHVDYADHFCKVQGAVEHYQIALAKIIQYIDDNYPSTASSATAAAAAATTVQTQTNNTALPVTSTSSGKYVYASGPLDASKLTYADIFSTDGLRLGAIPKNFNGAITQTVPEWLSSGSYRSSWGANARFLRSHWDILNDIKLLVDAECKKPWFCDYVREKSLGEIENFYARIRYSQLYCEQAQKALKNLGEVYHDVSDHREKISKSFEYYGQALDQMANLIEKNFNVEKLTTEGIIDREFKKAQQYRSDHRNDSDVILGQIGRALASHFLSVGIGGEWGSGNSVCYAEVAHQRVWSHDFQKEIATIQLQAVKEQQAKLAEQVKRQEFIEATDAPHTASTSHAEPTATEQHSASVPHAESIATAQQQNKLTLPSIAISAEAEALKKFAAQSDAIKAPQIKMFAEEAKSLVFFGNQLNEKGRSAKAQAVYDCAEVIIKRGGELYAGSTQDAGINESLHVIVRKAVTTADGVQQEFLLDTMTTATEGIQVVQYLKALGQEELAQLLSAEFTKSLTAIQKNIDGMRNIVSTSGEGELVNVCGKVPDAKQELNNLMIMRGEGDECLAVVGKSAEAQLRILGGFIIGAGKTVVNLADPRNIPENVEQLAKSGFFVAEQLGRLADFYEASDRRDYDRALQHLAAFDAVNAKLMEAAKAWIEEFKQLPAEKQAEFFGGLAAGAVFGKPIGAIQMKLLGVGLGAAARGASGFAKKVMDVIKKAPELVAETPEGLKIPVKIAGEIDGAEGAVAGLAARDAAVERCAAEKIAGGAKDAAKREGHAPIVAAAEREVHITCENMHEVFKKSEFGKQLKQCIKPCKIRVKGQKVYKIAKDFGHSFLKEDNYVYLDSCHKNHLEVFDHHGKVKCVLWCDGTINDVETSKVIREMRTIDVK